MQPSSATDLANERRKTWRGKRSSSICNLTPFFLFLGGSVYGPSTPARTCHIVHIQQGWLHYAKASFCSTSRLGGGPSCGGLVQ
eukprot:364417-Chlamydomonas_euryale.AAC.9